MTVYWNEQKLTLITVTTVTTVTNVITLITVTTFTTVTTAITVTTVTTVQVILITANTRLGEVLGSLLSTGWGVEYWDSPLQVKGLFKP